VSSVVVLGCLEETIDTLRHLAALGTKVDALVTLTEADAKKAGTTNWFDLAPFAREQGIPIHHVASYSLQDARDLALFQTLAPAVVYVVGWQRLVPEAILRTAAKGFIGFHGSCNFLPRGRGRSPINWSIIEARDRFILHMFFIEPGVDDGKVIGCEIYDIRPEDTCRSVYYKTALAQAALMHRFSRPILEGTATGWAQEGEPFYYPKRTPEDGRIDWSWPAEKICRLVRAVTRPYPGAFSEIRGMRVAVWHAIDLGDNQITAHAKPGEIVFVSANAMREVIVQTGRGAVLLSEYDAQTPLKTGDRFDG